MLLCYEGEQTGRCRWVCCQEPPGASRASAYFDTRSLALSETCGQGFEVRSSGCFRTRRKTSRSLLPEKGGDPLSRMYRMTPALHTSAG